MFSIFTVGGISDAAWLNGFTPNHMAVEEMGGFLSWFLLVIALIIFIGLPIFSGGGGLGYVLMPNFGFIIGFLIATVIISCVTQKLNNRNLWQHIIISLIGIAVITAGTTVGALIAILIFVIFALIVCILNWRSIAKELNYKQIWEKQAVPEHREAKSGCHQA